jgi:hypothetical protein
MKLSLLFVAFVSGAWGFAPAVRNARTGVAIFSTPEPEEHVKK